MKKMEEMNELYDKHTSGEITDDELIAELYELGGEELLECLYEIGTNAKKLTEYLNEE